MSENQDYSMKQNLAQAQAAMAQLMLLTGKESVTSGKIADTQVAFANKFETSTSDEVSKAKDLSVLSIAVAGLSGLMNMAGASAAFMNSSSVVGVLETCAKVAVNIALPAAKGALQCEEGQAQMKLGDVQKTQSEYGSAGQTMSGQSQTVIDAESEVAQKAASISRDLSQIIASEKQASMRG